MSMPKWRVNNIKMIIAHFAILLVVLFIIGYYYILPEVLMPLAMILTFGSVIFFNERKLKKEKEDVK